MSSSPGGTAEFVRRGRLETVNEVHPRDGTTNIATYEFLDRMLQASGIRSVKASVAKLF